MKKRSILRIILNVAILAGVLILISWVLSNNKKKNEEKTAMASQTSTEVAVKTQTVVAQELNADFSSNGNFQPFREMDYAAESAGRVVRILVKEGSYVRPGQTMAVIDAGLVNIDLESAQAALQNALRDEQRFENAYKTGGVTQQQLDQIKLTVENAKARVDQARIRSADANVRSSISGIVNKKYVETGAFVSPGTPLFELVDISRLKLVINVNEFQVTRLSLGDKAEITATVFPDKTFTGKITFIGNKADAALNFPVEIEVANNSKELKAGMYATARFNFSGAKPSIVIPRAAFAGSVSSNVVYVVEGDVARERTVVAGRVIGDQVEILKGLAEGEQVVTSGQINLDDGKKIALIR